METNVGSSGGLVLGMDTITGGDDDDGDGAMSSEDSSETEGNEKIVEELESGKVDPESVEELESEKVDPESVEQEFSAEDVLEEAKIKRVPNPADPTPEERARHYATHLPYRPWCKICVQAKAREDPHYKRVNTELKNGLPEICMDYTSLTETKDKSDKLRLLVGNDWWAKT